MKSCQNQVFDNSSIDREKSEYFCLVFRELLENCPSKCSHFISGVPLNLGLILKTNLAISCPFLHLIAQITPEDEKSFICSKKRNEPNCYSCEDAKSKP